MKTFAMLAAGVAAMGTVAATAQSRYHEAMHEAGRAHAAAAELVALTAPHAHCTPAWERVSRQAIAADNMAATVEAALAAGDFHTARDVAKRLSKLADDLEDDVEDLEPVATPFGRRQAHQELRRLESIAEALDDVSSDLRRTTRRLDRKHDSIRPAGPPVTLPGMLPAGPPRMNHPFPPTPSPYSAYETFPAPGGYQSPHPDQWERSYYGPGGHQINAPGGPTPVRPAPADSVRPSVPGTNPAGDLGPSLQTPPTDAFRSVPSSSSEYYGVSPASGSEPQPLPPTLPNESTVPQGSSRKIQQWQPGNGPALLAPSAMQDDADRL